LCWFYPNNTPSDLLEAKIHNLLNLPSDLFGAQYWYRMGHLSGLSLFEHISELSAAEVVAGASLRQKRIYIILFLVIT